MNQYSKKIKLALSILIFNFAWISCAMYYSGQRLLSASLQAIDLSILNTVEPVEKILKNAEWPAQRFEYLKENSPVEFPKTKNLIEVQVLQNLFGYDFPFFILRSIGGQTRIEIKNGAIVQNKTKLSIFREDSFLSLNFGTYLRPCVFDSILYLCVIDMPNSREFLGPLQRNLISIGIPISKLIVSSKLALSERASLLPPFSVVATLANDLLPLVGDSPKGRSIVSISLRVDEGFWLNASISALSFYRLAGFFSFLVTLALIGAIFIMECALRKRFFKKIELSLVKNKLEYFDQLQKIIRGVIHDIKSPMALLKVTNTQLGNGEASDHVALIIKRMEMIISDLERKISDPHSKDKILVPLFFAFKLIVKEKEREFFHPVSLKFEMSDGFIGKIWVEASYSELMRVMSNLLNNAFEACTKEKLISVVCKLMTDSSILVTIKDNGTGIPENLKERIFQHGATFGKPSGSGLGLYQGREFVRSLGGDMWVESRVGCGTEVHFTIPLQTPPPWSIGRIPLSKKKEVIVVDDEEYVAQIWRRKFAGTGKSITWFKSPDEIGSDVLRRSDAFFLVDNNYPEKIGEGLRFLELHPEIDAALVTAEWHIREVQEVVRRKNIYLIAKDFIEDYQAAI